MAVRQAAMIAMGSILIMANSGKKAVEAGKATNAPGASRIAEIEEQFDALEARKATVDEQIAETRQRLKETQQE